VRIGASTRELIVGVHDRMSNLPDHDRIREIVRRLDEIQQESELLRAKIDQIKNSSPEWPDRRSRMFDDVPRHRDDGLSRRNRSE